MSVGGHRMTRAGNLSLPLLYYQYSYTVYHIRAGFPRRLFHLYCARQLRIKTSKDTHQPRLTIYGFVKKSRHSGENRSPVFPNYLNYWIPAFAGMTENDIFQTFQFINS
jgi:hypothetical protein